MSASYIIINGSIAKAVNLPIIAPKSGGSNGLQSVVNMPGLVSIHQPQSTSESQNQNKPKSVVRKPKSTLFGLKWSEEEIIKFLQNYREHECLWDISHEHYRNKLARHVAYKDLRDDMEMPGLTVDGVINKIKSMRTTYKAELNKITRHNKHNVGEPPYKPNLFWFDMADEFLRTTYEIREIGDSKSDPASTSNIELSQDSDSSNVIEIKVEDIEVEDHDIGDSDEESSQSHKSLEIDIGTKLAQLQKSQLEADKKKNLTQLQKSLAEADRYKKTAVGVTEPNKKTVEEVPSSNIFTRILQEARNAAIKKQQGKRPASDYDSPKSGDEQPAKKQKVCWCNGEDEFDFFGKMIAVHLKKMPLDQAFVCQKKLMEVISQNRNQD